MFGVTQFIVCWRCISRIEAGLMACSYFDRFLSITCTTWSPLGRLLLVPAGGALAGVLGLPPQAQGLGAAEGRRSPDLLLLLAVDTFENRLLCLQGLRFGLGLDRDRFMGGEIK